ncbi:MAG TPA: hypothetical protein VFJ02_20495 [Vicinamibacterales bacterium]|nr:hypothetical protein [Vicinamibacterales bacterium]
MTENKPDATAATAQTQEPPQQQPGRGTESPPSAGGEFVVAPEATLADCARPYERRAGDPVYRPIKIFTLDPSISKLDGAVAVLKVPYEKLEPGPRGALFEVDNDDGFQRNQRVDLDDPLVVMSSGIDPTPSDPRFHQQMVYAVASSVYAVFRTALGRQINWTFPRSATADGGRLRLRPHARKDMANAFYDPAAGAIDFGYFRAAPEVRGRNLPGSWVFTCLSHDIIAHEVTHALVDSLRSHFTIPTNPDVLAFHEALGDLVAVFQHFTYRDVLERAIAGAGGNPALSPLLTDLAWQFSQTQQSSQYGEALRSAVQQLRAGERGPLYGERTEPHALGSILVSAIFAAFMTIFDRKSKRYIRLATGGSGVLPAGELSPHLIEVLAKEAASLASSFLSICIRAIDYCPPVDLLFGEYLRALITADYALVPDDPWMYREALVDAFRLRGIYPTDVPNLSEDALLWRAPEEVLPACPALSFAELRFRGDPSAPAGPDELARQARELGVFMTSAGRAHLFGLVTRDEAVRDNLMVGPPTVQSIRATRRVGPAGQIVFDVVAEVTQSRLVRSDRGRTFQFFGGSTVVLDPEGRIRYIVGKGVRSATREERQRKFMNSAAGRSLWMQRGGEARPKAQLFRLLHEPAPPENRSEKKREK